MADSTIQGLIPIDELEKDDLFPIWDNSAGNDNTKKATALQMAKFVGSAGLSSVNITSNTKDFVISIEGKELQDAMTLNITALVEITGSENDVLTIAYNGGEAKNIKVNKDGVLSDYVPFNVDSSWKFLQAFTSLDVKYIENLDCWIVVGNPVVISNSSGTSGYTIYSDGTIGYSKEQTENYALGVRVAGSFSNAFFNIGEDTKVTLPNKMLILLRVWDITNGNSCIVSGFYQRNVLNRPAVVSTNGINLTGNNQYGTFNFSGLNSTPSNNKYEFFYKLI